MADLPPDTPPSTRPSGGRSRGISKLALLLAFAAGAGAWWLVMERGDASSLDAPAAIITITH